MTGIFFNSREGFVSLTPRRPLAWPYSVPPLSEATRESFPQAVSRWAGPGSLVWKTFFLILFRTLVWSPPFLAGAAPFPQLAEQVSLS